MRECGFGGVGQRLIRRSRDAQSRPRPVVSALGRPSSLRMELDREGIHHSVPVAHKHYLVLK
jgi:hypothetical protein